MKRSNSGLMYTVLIFVLESLVYFPISVTNVSAAPPHPCFGNGAPGCNASCENNPIKLQATCCWLASDGKYTCQTCEVNTQTGEFENCYYEKTGELDDTVISQPPSDVASPPSTEKCPDNSARDNNGNCTPLTQSPDEEPKDDTNEPFEPEFPRGTILGESQINQDLQPQS